MFIINSELRLMRGGEAEEGRGKQFVQTLDRLEININGNKQIFNVHQDVMFDSLMMIIQNF